ncbi:MAG TPA: hypothetical protein VED17_07150, partial [Nitrososphaerales archaeon]|nr:hypothetical protein [Nitrososphaerales archaeon]
MTILFLSSGAIAASASSTGGTTGLISPTILAAGQSIPGNLVVSNGYAYWANWLSSIERVSKGGGTVLDLASADVSGLAIYQNNAYFDNNNGVFKV